MEGAYRQKWFDGECLRARKLSFKWLNIYRLTNSLISKESYLKANKMYKTLCKSKKLTYFSSLAMRLDSIRDSKGWWNTVKELRGKKFIIGSAIDIHVLKSHFQSLLSSTMEHSPILYAAPTTYCPLLDDVMEMHELVVVLGCLKDNKAPGVDRIPYEFYKNAPDVFLERLLNFYNYVFEKEEFPSSFTQSVIFPIHKKGSVADFENYRGLSSMNTIAKIFTTILYNRLSSWEKQNGILSESQAGFRTGYSTTDNVFNLVNIIKLSQCYNKKKIYAFFVDFKSAFDKITRSSLFYKLYNCGVSSKMVRILQSLYKDTKSQIWDGVKLSDEFVTDSGVKQGCVLSPLLFALFINDLEDCLEPGLIISDIEIRALMYADDIVLLADDPIKLQRMICKLEEYCKLWNLEVNLNKSKVMIFRRGGGVRKHNEQWIFTGIPVEIVNRYTYLGIVLKPTLSMTEHLKERLQNAKVGLSCTWKHFLRKDNIKHSEKIKIFYAVSRAILCYGAQVWGFTRYDDVEKLQRFFLKNLFYLPQNSPNYALTLETGLLDLYVYTLKCHFLYMLKVLFKYNADRLPRRIAWLVVDKGTYWHEVWSELAEKHNVDLNVRNESWSSAKAKLLHIVDAESEWLVNVAQDKARGTVRHELYDKLKYTSEQNYFKNDLPLRKISTIFKFRCGMVELNASPWRKEGSSQCSLCNLSEDEDLLHFLGICPILSEFRVEMCGKKKLTMEEVIDLLNGRNDYKDLLFFVEKAWKYRSYLVSHFNC